MYVAIALSGCAALGAEVVWTRLLSLMLGATVYTFSIILAVFLVGLGIGSAAASALARGVSAAAGVWLVPDAAGGAMAWTAFMIAVAAHWPINPPLATILVQLSAGPGALPVGHSARAVPVGREFSAGAGGGARGQDPGRLVGGVYAANTVGAILGALASACS